FMGLFVFSQMEVEATPLDEVTKTRHNLLAPSRTQESACTPCHTESIPWASSSSGRQKGKGPLKAVAPPPLWSGRISASPYRATQDVPLSEQPYNHPTNSSLVCLGCHDGALGTDMHGINVDSPRVGASPSAPWKGMAGAREASPLSRVDHPISIPYPRNAEGRFVPLNPTVTRSRYWALPDRDAEGLNLPTTATSSYLDLPNAAVSSPEHLSALVRTTMGKVECDSCHNPHSESVRPFLRVPSKTLCLVCHDR
ncbi:MAG: cytochrome c3 family protein, partial [Nitrospiria bacterium]